MMRIMCDEDDAYKNDEDDAKKVLHSSSSSTHSIIYIDIIIKMILLSFAMVIFHQINVDYRLPFYIKETTFINMVYSMVHNPP